MGKADLMCVEHLALDAIVAIRLFRAIEGIAEDRGVAVFKVDADLVGTPGDELDVDEGEVVLGGKHADYTLGLFAPFRANCHAGTMNGVAADGGVDKPLIGVTDRDG